MIRYNSMKRYNEINKGIYRTFSSIEEFKKWWNLYKTEHPNANPNASLDFLVSDQLYTSVNDVLNGVG